MDCMIAVDALADIPLFCDLNEAQRARIADVSYQFCVEVGGCVLREAEPVPPYFHVLVSGTIQVFKTAHSGKETTIRLIRPGEVFAWAALLDGGPAPATARALMRCHVVAIPYDAMMTMMAQEPALSLRLLATLVERLRDLHEQLHDVMSERARTRVARLILRHRRRDGLTPTLLPHAVLARMAGIAYEESVRIIGEWTHGPHPLLTYGRGGRIGVLDEAALLAIADGLDLPDPIPAPARARGPH